MKNITLIISFLFLGLSSKTFAQNTLTWIPIDSREVSLKTESKGSISGFKSESDVLAFCEKVRTNADVISCESLGKDSNGNYIIHTKMKKAYDAEQYLGWAKKMGITYFQIKGEKKTTDQIIQEIRSNRK